MVHQGGEFDMRRGEIVAYRGSESFVFGPERYLRQKRTQRVSFLPKKWKDGGEDESILMEKWLTFHDRKWLIFKRPLTDIAFINNFKEI